MTVLLAIGAIVLITLPVALMSAEEAASSLLAPSRIHRLEDADRSGAASLSRLMEKAYRFHASAALISGVAYSAATAVSAWAVNSLAADVDYWTAPSLGLLWE